MHNHQVLRVRENLDAGYPLIMRSVLMSATLESGIDKGQGIHVGPGINVGHQNFNSVSLQSRHCCCFITFLVQNFPKFNKRRAFNKAVGPEKKYKINKRRAFVYSGL